MPERTLPARLDGPAELAALIGRCYEVAGNPIIVAIDGRSGAGKSTLAGQLATSLGASVVEGDDFFAGGADILAASPRERAARCIDWRRQRSVLSALRAGGSTTHHAFDWDAFDGRLAASPTHTPPAAIILHEGVYSARPELSDLTDLAIRLLTPDDVRLARLAEREGGIGAWERQWHEAEDWYFSRQAPLSRFDVVIGEGD